LLFSQVGSLSQKSDWLRHEAPKGAIGKQIAAKGSAASRLDRAKGLKSLGELVI
jgi:hypothetical protein